ncbi:DBH-like monooxygenase protein 1 [Neocloeon triangulifer]|uniref:DBH-like monooxygenase protein 1 n=1 Tax=Neocloeon triangulifer TaxID=2078957 RepID=UPI00286F54E9|nr:DBH-like monooxygenase protein 1 [Neocloeon triangulifer]
MSKILLCLTSLLLFDDAVADMVFARRVTLSPGLLHLLWTPGQEYLMLRVEVKTQGYFAISFGSVHGDAKDTQDALLGWTDDAEVLLQDAVVRRDGIVISDKTNDYELLEGARNESDFLSVTVQRKWSTCDQLEDMPLGAGSVLVSWAVYSSTPDNLEEFARLEEGERHGSQVVIFNAPPPPLPPTSGLRVWPVMLPKIRVSSNSSFLRWCTMFQAPETKNKHWIVGAKPEINHPGKVKKIIIYECRTETVESGPLAPGQAGRACNTPDSVPNVCNTIALVWTPGNIVIMFPKDVGIPVSLNSGGTDYYLLRVFYSLSDSSEVVIDSSGLNVLLTSKKPKHQASFLQIGLDPDALLVLPPRQPAVIVRGWCFQQCLSNFLQAVQNQEINLVSVLLMGQSALRKVVLRHLHESEELAPIVIEFGFQSESQEVRFLDPKRRINAAFDNLILECEFNTQDRDRTTLGGENSDDETCMGYVLYYPRTALSSCFSQTVSTRILDLLELKNKTNDISQDFQILSEPKILDAILNFDWGAKNISSKIEALQRELMVRSTKGKCVNTFGDQIGSPSRSLSFYQEQLVALSKITRCGIWTNKAQGHERQRSGTVKKFLPIFAIFVFTVILVSIS